MRLTIEDREFHVAAEFGERGEGGLPIFHPLRAPRERQQERCNVPGDKVIGDVDRVAQ